MSAVARTSVNNLRAQAPQPAEEGDYPKLQRKLNSLDRDFMALLGSRESVDRFKRVVLNAVSANPKLLTCDGRSLLGAAMKAAQDGLMPDGRECVLNIYNTKRKDPETGREEWVPTAQYLPMVAGLVKKLYEAGAQYVDAAAVFEKDEFIYERGDNVRLLHRPYLGSDPGAIVAAYVVVKMATGEIKREVMPRRDIDKVRAASKSEKGPWVEWFDQMAIKSVIRRAYKQLPNSPALDNVIASDNEASGLAGLPNAASNYVPQIEHQPTQGIDTNAAELDSRQNAELEAIDGAAERVEEHPGTSAPTGTGKRNGGAPSKRGGPTYAEVEAMIANAKTPEQLANVRAMFVAFDPDQAEALRMDADEREAELKG